MLRSPPPRGDPLQVLPLWISLLPPKRRIPAGANDLICRNYDIKLVAILLVTKCTIKQEKEAFCERHEQFLSDLVRELSNSLVQPDASYDAGGLLEVVKAFCMCSHKLASQLAYCGLVKSLALLLRDKYCDNNMARRASKCLLHLARTLPDSKEEMRDLDAIEGLHTSYLTTRH